MKSADALQEGKCKDAPTRLSSDQLTQLVTELKKVPEQHGFHGMIWTRPWGNAVIKKLFGITYDPSQVSRILKKVGWSRQKPQPKARQQSIEAVNQWRTERLPERREPIKVLLRERSGRIHLERLPAYSPEFNPVELVWGHLKCSLKNQVFTNLDELTVAILEQAKRLEKNPTSVKAFFNKKEIAFITD